MLSRALTRCCLHPHTRGSWSRSSSLLLSSAFPTTAPVFSPLLSHRSPLTAPPRRSLIVFPTTPNLPDDPAELEEYEEEPDEDEQDEAEEELKRERDEPSKAERLKLKEKEKRRQKMAMRERTDGKRRKDGWKQEQKPVKIKKRDEWEDVTAAADDTADAADVIDGEVIARRRLRRNGRGAGAAEEEEEAEEEDEDEDEEPLDPRPLNSAIKADPIVLVDGNGKRIGLVSLQAALAKAREAELDILQLSPPKVSPPVCRVVDYAAFIRAEDAKRRKAGLPSLLSPERRVKRVVKTVQMRKSIDPHDLQHKVRVMRDWLSRGYQVRLMYFEKEIVREEQLQLFDKLAQLLQGAGVWVNQPASQTTSGSSSSSGSSDSGAAEDEEQPVVEKGSKPVAVFDPVKKETATAGGKKDKKQAKADKQQQQPQQQQLQTANAATLVNGTVTLESNPASAAVPPAVAAQTDVQEQPEAEATEAPSTATSTKRQKDKKKKQQKKQQLSTA